MRCTQEQFDSIKDRINLPINDTMFDLKQYPYLTNNFFCGNRQGLGTHTKSLIKKEVEIHETFNADIFLEACGVEVEKVWDVSEMQYLSKLTNEWIDCTGENSKFRFKPQPDYSKEIEALQNKAIENGMKVTINFEKL
jgi:hypothetical protein